VRYYCKVIAKKKLKKTLHKANFAILALKDEFFAITIHRILLRHWSLSILFAHPLLSVTKLHFKS
jgi:hypothetical protein